MLNKIFLFTLFFILIFSGRIYSLASNEVLVIANKNASKSVSLAKYYMDKRGIPEKNLLIIWITDKETCSRAEYKNKAVIPIKRYLKKSENSQIRAIVTFYGIPLKIEETSLNKKDAFYLKSLKDRIDKISKIKNKSESELKKAQIFKNKLRSFYIKTDTKASFDSELFLIKKDNYEIKKWIKNPFFPGTTTNNKNIKKSNIIMVSRLDGPDHKIVKRIIDDTIFAEKNGLRGSACFDARWKFSKKITTSYSYYDNSIHKAYKILKDNQSINTILNDKTDLFKKDECQNPSLYCGWYSHGRYKDVFKWTRGSVGYHIASSECATLKSKNTTIWCKKMIDKGISATIGPIEEPFLQSFPVPELFFSCLVNKGLSLSESYLVSCPYLSWKMVLVGDPLYRLKIENNN